MPRPPSPEIRRALIDNAAALLAQREPVTLKALVHGTGASTMAVYTYFDGMPGLWSAVRQEGFTRLTHRLTALRRSPDPVRHLARLGVAYAQHALENPDLFRVMFDSLYELPDPAGAAAGFEPLIDGVARAQAAGRFDAGSPAGEVATRYWATGHGIVSLTVTGVLSRAELRQHAPAAAVAQFVAAGDDPVEAAASVTAAWRSSRV